MELPVINRTNISSLDQITYCNSEVHLRLEYLAMKTATVYLWVWSGAQNKELGEPNQTLIKALVAPSDKYIEFDIAQLIQSYLINPPDASNTDQPTFLYNEIGNPTITGQGVFWQIVADITTDNGTTRYNFNTQFATLGYGKKFDNFTTTPQAWYNPNVHNYIAQNIKLNTTVATATTSNIIEVVPIVPTDANTRCSRDPYLIVFLNRKGLFEMFTPNGKVTVSQKIESSTSNRTFRDPSRINHNLTHSKLKSNVSVTESYMINTGNLFIFTNDEDLAIILSPKVYLIKFKGDKQTSADIGVTIDSTIISIDTLTITIDSETITSDYLNYFKTHEQMPVIVTDSDFVRKTRLNDKSSIDYTLKLEQTVNLIG